MRKELTKKAREERGASMVEYALIAALVAAALVIIIPRLNVQVSQGFSRAGSAIAGGQSGVN